MGQDFWDAQRWQREFETKQIIHTEAYIGMSKVESTVAACYFINSTTQIVEHKEAFRTSNALRDCEQIRCGS
ncbi:hypothetical protein P3S67_029464 [Capsicum chacoense]